MRSLLKIAWRNIWRNRRRTLINMSAVGFGLFLVIFYAGLIGGMVGDAKSQLDNAGMGHVEITAPGWRLRHGAAQVLSEPRALLARLRLPPGAEVGARVVSRGLITSARNGQGVAVHGIDPVAEKQLAAYLNDIRAGGPIAADDAQGILLGEQLAERLGVRVGSKVRLMVQRGDGEVGADLYRVRGIFHAISPGISRGLVMISAASAQALLGLKDAAHQVVIQLPNADDADQVAASLRSQLGEGYEVVTYADLLPVLKELERLENSGLMIAALFIYLLVGLGILNTMLMSVLERTREFGVMRALGSRPRRIVAEVLAEAFWIATISVVVGLALGLLVTWVGSERPLLDFRSSLGESFELGGTVMKTAFRTELSIGAGLKASALVYLLTLLVGLYPAWRISRLQPADAIRTA
jgi:ABC-type lipoprotein release transport system permease subunit